MDDSHVRKWLNARLELYQSESFFLIPFHYGTKVCLSHEDTHYVNDNNNARRKRANLIPIYLYFHQEIRSCVCTVEFLLNFILDSKPSRIDSLRRPNSVFALFQADQ